MATITKIIDNGPDGQKLVFAILGDGYAAADQTKFADDVNRLLVEGMLAQDFFRENRRAFNAYRVDLVSNESGVSTPSTERDTALKLVYTGRWEDCWIRESSGSDALIRAASSGIAYEYLLIVANENGFGGCRRGTRLYVTSGVDWPVVAHEYGHGIGNLFDEYFNPGTYDGPPINVRNCSTLLDRTRVVWKGLIAATTAVPTVLAAGIDPNQTVGMFEGCHYKAKGIYRPVHNCRMRGNTPLFCPVCHRIMTDVVSPYLGGSPALSQREEGGAWQRETLSEENRAMNENPPAPPAGTTFLHLVVRVSPGGDAEVIDATEHPGPVLLKPAAMSSFFYEVYSGDQSVATEALPEDPFVLRGFSDPQNDQGHQLARAEWATIVVKAPNQSLADAVSGAIGFRVYQLQPGDEAVDRIEPDVMRALEDANRITPIVEYPAARLAADVAKRLAEKGHQ